MNATKFPPIELVPHDTVVKELVSDTVDYGAELGVGGERFSSGSFSQALFVSIKVRELVLLCMYTNHCCSLVPRPLPELFNAAQEKLLLFSAIVLHMKSF